MRSLRLLGAVGAALLVGCGGGGAGSVSSTTDFQAAVHRAHDAVKTAYETHGLSNGVIVEVTSPFGTWVDAQGFADAQVTPMLPDMTFRAASITKLFTAMAALQVLGEQGISPTDRIADYLPNPNAATAKSWPQITIEELANHTSGLMDTPTVGPLNPPPGGLPWTTTTLIPTAQVVSAPGATYNYANINFTILAALVESLTNESLGQNIQDRFVKPLGLTNTVLTSSGTSPMPGCHGFRGGNSAADDITTDDPSWAYGAGNIVSNVSDLSKWLRAMFAGNLISPSAKAILTKTGFVSTTTGFGVQLYSTWLGHTGRIDGYASAAFYNPSLDATVVVVVNRWDGQTRVAPEFAILRAITQQFFPGYPIQEATSSP